MSTATQKDISTTYQVFLVRKRYDAHKRIKEKNGAGFGFQLKRAKVMTTAAKLISTAPISAGRAPTISFPKEYTRKIVMIDKPATAYAGPMGFGYVVHKNGTMKQ